MKKVHIIMDGKIIIQKCNIATDFFSRLRGLMFRKQLSESEAIFFPHCNSIHTFFMRFPIDAIFIDNKYRVQKIIESVKPWKVIFPQKNVFGVIETKSLTAKNAGIKTGKEIKFLEYEDNHRT